MSEGRSSGGGEEGRCPHDPFREARDSTGLLAARLDGEVIPMVLRMKDLRAVAKDWATFSSDAAFRVPIPSEETKRSVRQLPIETDPPLHTEYRAVVEPFFLQPRSPEYVARMESLVGRMLEEAIKRSQVEVLREFALPLQNRALALLLKVPAEEAERWIEWGVHPFHEEPDGSHKGGDLEAYLRERLERAEGSEGEDFFSALCRAEFRGRRLTEEERLGFANLTFAGGRDTVFNSIAFAIAQLSGSGGTLEWLREDPRRINPAVEELFRALSPISHIGRVCPAETDLLGFRVPANGRVALTWAAANFDPAVFDDPESVRLDRKPNPHVAFGFGPHTCLGVHHARLLLRTLVGQLSARLREIEEVESEPNYEVRQDYKRWAGYHRLVVRMHARA